jgi:AcrR family transcriptional regulator
LSLLKSSLFTREKQGAIKKKCHICDRRLKLSQNSSDLRVRRTQKLLREALIALIEERSFDTITVGEIAERAMVSRAAFYRYYQDKYDLVEKIFEEMVISIVHEIDPLRRSVINRFDSQATTLEWADLFGQIPESQQTPEAWVKICEHFEQYERLYRALLGKRGSTWFATQIRAYIAETLSDRLLALADALNHKQIVESRVFADGFMPALIAGQIVDAITWWLEHDRPYTSREIATYCYRLMCSMLKEVGTWEL